MIVPQNSLGFANEKVESKRIGGSPGITQPVMVKQ